MEQQLTPRQRRLVQANARVSLLAGLAPVSVSLQQWGSGSWERVGEYSFDVIWLAVVAAVVVETFVATRSGVGRVHALCWLALVALANPWAPPIVQTLLSFRVVRGIRIRREFVKDVGDQVFSDRGLRFVVFLTGLALFGFGWLFVVVENEPGLDVGDGVWWALVTATTTGYGDIVPTTTLARLLGSILMILGLVVAGLLTGAVAERFTRRRRGDDAQRLDELAARLERIEAALARRPPS